MDPKVKTLIVIFFAALSTSIGEVLLSYGMRKSGQIDLANPSHLVTLVLSVVRNPYIFAGVVFTAIFFFLYLTALSWADLSFVMPLTSLSYLFATLIAKYLLGEEVSWFRWAGTAVIIIGITLIALDNKQRTEVSRLIKHRDAPPAADVTATHRSPGKEGNL
ncbi:MAG: DMT family transporter [Nitrospirota bacterium]